MTSIPDLTSFFKNQENNWLKSLQFFFLLLLLSSSSIEVTFYFQQKSKTRCQKKISIKVDGGIKKKLIKKKVKKNSNLVAGSVFKWTNQIMR